MTDTDQTIHTAIRATVMRRVRTIHALRSAASGVGTSALLLILSLYLIGREVWVARVWQNMPDMRDFLAVARFFEAAFLNTTFAVQALTLLAAFALLWLARESIRLVKAPLHAYA